MWIHLTERALPVDLAQQILTPLTEALDEPPAVVTGGTGRGRCGLEGGAEQLELDR